MLIALSTSAMNAFALLEVANADAIPEEYVEKIKACLEQKNAIKEEVKNKSVDEESVSKVMEYKFRKTAFLVLYMLPWTSG